MTAFDLLWLRCAEEQAERFWLKVARGGVDECWLWTGGLDKDGYGKFAITLPWDGERNPQKHVRAHRLAFILARGWTKLIVRHDCDTPACCNPACLRDGTQADNRRDCIERGRHPRGEASARAKLTMGQVEIIRGARGRETSGVLAARFGVSRATVGHVWSGRNWGLT